MRFKHVKSFNFPSKKTTNRVGCDATGDDRGTPTAFNPDSSHTSLSKNVFIVTDFVFFFVISAILVRSGKFFPNPERNKSNEIIHADLESGRGGRLFRFHVLAPESPEDAKQRSPTDVVPEMLFAAR